MTEMKWNDLMEFNGQIVDYFEDYMNAIGIRPNMIPCEDREEAIRDGSEPEECAIIYGSDYDAIVGCIESAAFDKGMDSEQIGNVFPISFYRGEFENLRQRILDGFDSVWGKMSAEDLAKYRPIFQRDAIKISMDIERIFDQWGMLEPERTKEYWEAFAETLNYREASILQKVLERSRLIEDIKNTLQDPVYGLGGSLDGAWMRTELAKSDKEGQNKIYDEIIDYYYGNQDTTLSLWENLVRSIEYVTQGRMKKPLNHEEENER